MSKKILISIFIFIIIQAPAFAGTKYQIVIPELVLEENENDENYIFPRMTYLFMDDEENIYAMLYEESYIRKYNKDGKYLFQFGGFGEGPGELILPLQMAFDKDKIIIYQPRAITTFTKDGKFLEIEKKRKSKYNFRNIKIRENVYLQEDFDPISKTVKLFIGESVDNIGLLIEEQDTEYTEHKRDTKRGSSFEWTNHFFFTADSKKIPIYYSNDNLIIKEYKNGKSRVLISLDFTKRKIVYENGKPNPDWSDYYQVLSKLQLDKQDNIWLQIISNEFTGILRFSRDGIETGRYPVACCNLLPHQFYPFKDYLYYITASELEGIKVFRIKL